MIVSPLLSKARRGGLGPSLIPLPSSQLLSLETMNNKEIFLKKLKILIVFVPILFFSVDDNDVPLLLAVASTHSPQSMPLVS